MTSCGPRSWTWGRKYTGCMGCLAPCSWGGWELGDWVRTPPELGDQEHRILEIYRAPCAQHPTHDALHLTLGGADVCCCQCPETGNFLWYRVRD